MILEDKPKAQFYSPQFFFINRKTPTCNFSRILQFIFKDFHFPSTGMGATEVRGWGCYVVISTQRNLVECNTEKLCWAQGRSKGSRGLLPVSPATGGLSAWACGHHLQRVEEFFFANFSCCECSQYWLRITLLLSSQLKKN